MHRHICTVYKYTYIYIATSHKPRFNVRAQGTGRPKQTKRQPRGELVKANGQDPAIDTCTYGYLTFYLFILLYFVFPVF
jgi:hypothetical protein